MKQDSDRNPTLDLIRALAAFTVVVHHARNLFFVDYHPGMSLFFKAFYFISNLGPQAVMVFFVLSGYFVGGSVLRKMRSDRWRWRDYALDRLSRLWVVLIAALVITCILDVMGMHFFGGKFYAGTEGNMLLQSPVSESLGAGNFVCNVFFLQTLMCPTFGSNGPLWSLANEFWYYIWFPALLAVFFAKYRSKAACVLAILAIISIVAFFHIFTGFILWCLGVVAYTLRVSEDGATATFMRRFEWPACLLFLATLAASRLHLANDFMIGTAFFVYLICLLQRKTSGVSGATARWSINMSEQSYTLYLAHMPFIVFIMSGVWARRLEPSFGNFAIYLGLVIVTYLYAFLLYFLFERRTGWVRAKAKSCATLIANAMPKASHIE